MMGPRCHNLVNFLQQVQALVILLKRPLTPAASTLIDLRLLQSPISLQADVEVQGDKARSFAKEEPSPKVWT